MTIHLIKLSVGPESLADLERWQKSFYRAHGELMHVTRQMPKQVDELLNDGSIYWVIKGMLCARQKLTELRPLMLDGVPHCGIIYEPELIRVTPRPHRAFQGWRYLKPQDAPPDLKKGSGVEDMPEHVRRELAELGLL